MSKRTGCPINRVAQLSKKMKPNNNTLENLPPEVLSTILSFNEGCELVKMRRINKEWNTIIDEHVNWKAIVTNRLGFLPIVPVSLERSLGENLFWQEYFKCKIAYGKYATIHECRQKGQCLGKVSEFCENPEKHQLLTYSVESITRKYCNLFHPEFKITKSEHEEDDEEDEEDESSESTEFLFWNIPLKSLTSGFSVGNSDDLIAIGESKIGGSPDLPKNFKWPILVAEGDDDEEKKWIFACQINIKQLSYYDRTHSVIPQDGGMLYFFCDPYGGGNGTYCAPDKSKAQPVLYFTEKQIRDMGGLERQEGKSYSHGAKMKFHSVPIRDWKNSMEEEIETPFNRSSCTERIFSMFSGKDFDFDIDDIELSSEETEQFDWESQSHLLTIYSGEHELRSGDGYLWEWGLPNHLIGKHEYYGCAVGSGDP